MVQTTKDIGSHGPRHEKNVLRVTVFLAVAALVGGGVALAQGGTTSPVGFFTVTPCRVLDTRDATGPYGGPALPANGDRTFVVAGRCGIPSTADSISANVTVTGSTAGGDLRIYPGGYPLPLASAINYGAGNTRANNGKYALSGNGSLGIHCDQASGTVHVILDVSGYFETGMAPPPTPTPTPTPTPPPSSTWSRAWGSSSDDRAQAVAVDQSGGVAVTGHLDGTSNLGGGNVSSYVHPSLGPTVDVVVAAYAANGAYRWARVIGAEGAEEGKGIATDGSANIIVTGYQGSYAVDYGGGPQLVSAGNDIFVAKYSSTGAWVWSKTVGGTGYDQGNAVAADDAGNVFVTGYFGVSNNGINFGGGSLSSAGASDVFLVKYSPTGSHVWSKRFGSTGNDNGYGVSTDSSGNVFIGGTFEGSVDFGGGGLSSSGQRDIFVAKFSATGAHIWSKRFGGSGDDALYGLAVDTAGNVAISGKFQGSVNFGGGNLSSAGGDDAFAAKLSGSSGAHVWSKRFGSTSGDVSTAIAVDGSDNVVVAGYFSGSVDFGGGALSSFGVDVFVAKYSAAGGHTWSRRYGGMDAQLGSAVAAAPGGNVTVGGFFGYGLDLGSGTLPNAGAYDAFLGSIGP